MVGPFIKASFDTLLKLHKVIHFDMFVTMFADTRTEVLGGEEQAGFRYGTVESAVLRGESRWTPG